MLGEQVIEGLIASNALWRREITQPLGLAAKGVIDIDNDASQGLVAVADHLAYPEFCFSHGHHARHLAAGELTGP